MTIMIKLTVCIFSKYTSLSRNMMTLLSGNLVKLREFVSC